MKWNEHKCLTPVDFSRYSAGFYDGKNVFESDPVHYSAIEKNQRHNHVVYDNSSANDLT